MKKLRFSKYRLVLGLLLLLIVIGIVSFYFQNKRLERGFSPQDIKAILAMLNKDAATINDPYSRCDLPNCQIIPGSSYKSFYSFGISYSNSGISALAQKQPDGSFKLLYESQEPPNCALVLKYQVPNEVEPECYNKDRLVENIIGVKDISAELSTLTSEANGWNLYTDKSLGFEFRYPKNWTATPESMVDGVYLHATTTDATHTNPTDLVMLSFSYSPWNKLPLGKDGTQTTTLIEDAYSGQNKTVIPATFLDQPAFIVDNGNGTEIIFAGKDGEYRASYPNATETTSNTVLSTFRLIQE